MAECDGSSSGVHLLVRQLQDILAVYGHGGEGLVDFDDVDVVDGDIVLAEELGDSDRGADAHDARCKTGDGGADELGENGLAELDGAGALHEEDSGSYCRVSCVSRRIMLKRTSIGNLGGVSSGRLVTKGREGRTNLGEALICGTPSWALILCQGDILHFSSFWVLDLRLDRHDLIIEPTRLLCHLSPSVRFRRISILALPGDVEILADVLTGLSHRLHAVRCFLVLEDLRVEWAFQTIAADGHQLGAHSNTNIDRAIGDLGRDILGGLQAGGAESVDGGCSCGIGESCSQGSRSDNICSLAFRNLLKV